nr:putative nuclease HARBI1 [Tanacetum cinerariifolium]
MKLGRQLGYNDVSGGCGSGVGGLWWSLWLAEGGSGGGHQMENHVGEEDEWWKMKIKEDLNFKKTTKKQSSLELQYAWDQLFGDVVAGGEDCISSAMNTKAFQDVPNENAEAEDVESDDDLDGTQEGTQVDNFEMEELQNTEPSFFKSFIGEDWMKDVLNGNSIRCVNAFRMHPHIFKKLCRELQANYGLKSSDKMSALEKLGIFVYTFALGVSNRDVGERFQRSGETISRAFHDVLDAITAKGNGFNGLSSDIIRPKDPSFPIPHQIMNDKRYMSYFKDCIGCIDGTHIGACIPEAQQVCYIGKRGIPTFNVMATCDFNMCFTFISVGWEGLAHDTHVFLHAINTQAMNFPKPLEGKYYLVDKGYPKRNGYLVSYIERPFGILKKRWKLLGGMPQFSVKTQIAVIMAAFALHHYIRNSDEEDMMFTMIEQHPNYIPSDELHDVRGHETNTKNVSQGTSNEMKRIRDDIAASIWNARPSKARKAAKNHDPLALLAHSNAFSLQSHVNFSYSPQPYYVTHPSFVDDYKDEYQRELQGDSQEDKFTISMMLLARAITQKFSTPTNNHLRTSSNIRNQVVIHDGRVDIQTKNSGYGGNGNRNSGRKYKNQAFNAGNGNDDRKANVQGYNCNEKGHYARDCQKPRVRDAKDETLKELSVAVIMMAQIQPANDNADSEPSYDAKAVSEVNASNKVHEHVNHVKRKTIIHASDDDQIDSNIICDDPYVENNGGTSEHDSNAHDEYHNIQILAYNVQKEVKNKKRLNNELKKQNELLQKELETFKDRVKTFE